MKHAWLIALAFVPRPLLALDLTPAHGFRELEGFRIPVVRFVDGPRKVTYQPPADWRLSGGGQSIQIFPTGRDEAAVQFRTERRPEGNAGAGAEDFEHWTRAHLPPDAKDVESIGEAVGQFSLGAQASRALTFSYTLSGRRFHASVASVNLGDKERLAIVVTARQADFKSVHDEAIASLFSWQWEDE